MLYHPLLPFYTDWDGQGRTLWEKQQEGARPCPGQLENRAAMGLINYSNYINYSGVRQVHLALCKATFISNDYGKV